MSATTRTVLWALVFAAGWLFAGPLASHAELATLDVRLEQGLLAPAATPVAVEEVLLLELDERAVAARDGDPWEALVELVERFGEAEPSERPRHLIVLPPEGLAPSPEQSRRLTAWHERWETLWLPWSVSPDGHARRPWPGAGSHIRDGARQLQPNTPAGAEGVRSQSRTIQVRTSHDAGNELVAVPHIGTQLTGHAESLPARLRFDERLVPPLLAEGRISAAPLLIEPEGAVARLHAERPLGARWVVLGVTAKPYAGEPVALPGRAAGRHELERYVAPAVAETLVLRAFAGGRWTRELPLAWQLAWLAGWVIGSALLLARLPLWGLLVWAPAVLLAWWGVALWLYDAPRPLYAPPWGTLALVVTGCAVEVGRRFHHAVHGARQLQAQWRTLAEPARLLREGRGTAQAREAPYGGASNPPVEGEERERPRRLEAGAAAAEPAKAEAAREETRRAELRESTATRRRRVARDGDGSLPVPPVDVSLDRLATVLRQVVPEGTDLTLHLREPGATTELASGSTAAPAQTEWVLLARNAAPDPSAPVAEAAPNVAGRAPQAAEPLPSVQVLPADVVSRLRRGELVLVRRETAQRESQPSWQLLIPALEPAEEPTHTVLGFAALDIAAAAAETTAREARESTTSTSAASKSMSTPGASTSTEHASPGKDNEAVPPSTAAESADKPGATAPPQPKLSLTPAMQAALVGETSRVLEDVRWRLAVARLDGRGSPEEHAEDGAGVSAQETRLARRLIPESAHAYEWLATSALSRGMRLQQALEALPVGVALAELDGQIVTANLAYRELLDEANRRPSAGLKPLAETLAAHTGRLVREEFEELLDTAAQPLGPSGRMVVPLTLAGREYRLTIKSLPGMLTRRSPGPLEESRVWNRPTKRRIATAETEGPVHAGLLAVLEPLEAQARWARARVAVNQLLAERADRWTWAATMRALFDLEARTPSLPGQLSVGARSPLGLPATEAYQLCREAAHAQGRELHQPSGMARAIGRVEVPLRLRALLRALFGVLLRVWPALPSGAAISSEALSELRPPEAGLALHSPLPGSTAASQPGNGAPADPIPEATTQLHALQRAFDEQRRRDAELPDDLATIGVRVTFTLDEEGRLRAEIRWRQDAQ